MMRKAQLSRIARQNDFVRGQSGLVEKFRSDVASSQSASLYQVSKFPVVTNGRRKLYGNERNSQSGSQRGKFQFGRGQPSLPSLLSISTLKISFSCILFLFLILLILHRIPLLTHLYLHLSRFYIVVLLTVSLRLLRFPPFLPLALTFPCLTFVFYASTGVLTVYFDLDLREISRNSLGAGSSLGKIPFCTQRLLSQQLRSGRSAAGMQIRLRVYNQRDFATINKIRIAGVIRTIDYVCLIANKFKKTTISINIYKNKTYFLILR